MRLRECRLSREPTFFASSFGMQSSTIFRLCYNMRTPPARAPRRAPWCV